MRRSPTAVLAGETLISVIISIVLGGCEEPPAPTDGQVEGALLAKSLAQHMEVSRAWTAPYRCARLATDLGEPNVESVAWDDAHNALIVEPSGKSPRFATIADARATVNSDSKALEDLRDALNQQKIDVLISLGGLAVDEESIHRVLAPLTSGAEYLVLALPGDRESLPAHRAAIAALAKAGARILDASRYRFTHIGGLRLATMPGVSKAAHVIAGDDGCLHTEADVTELQSSLAASKAPTLLLSYAPWRQQGTAATDLGIGGIHTGEIELRPLAETGQITALVHGMVSPKGTASSGSIHLGAPPNSIATGSLSEDENTPTALLLSVSGAKLSWKRLPVH